MGMYDGPHFRCEDRNVVSIWVTRVKLSAVPADYMAYNHGGNDDEPWSTFSSNFGFGYYDDDFAESFAQPSKRSVSLYKQLKYLSYSTSFIDAAVAKAREKGLERTAWVFLLYNFAYDPGVTKIERDAYMAFLGVFPFDEKSKPVEQWPG